MWIVWVVKLVKKIPLWAWLLIGVGLGFWAMYHKGRNDEEAKWLAIVERNKVGLAQLKSQQVTVNMIVDTVIKERIVTIKEKARVIEKEIPVFIPEYRDLLGGGFRLLHDASASNSIPDRSGIATASPVSIGDVASTVNRNYEQCHIWREQVVGWQSWYNKHKNLKPSQ